MTREQQLVKAIEELISAWGGNSYGITIREINRAKAVLDAATEPEKTCENCINEDRPGVRGVCLTCMDAEGYRPKWQPKPAAEEKHTMSVYIGDLTRIADALERIAAALESK